MLLMSKERLHMSIVVSVGCVICRRDTGHKVQCHVHHIGEGSGKRNSYRTAGLCELHHTGSLGVHGMGVKAFLRLFRIEKEEHLIDLVNQYRAEDGV